MKTLMLIATAALLTASPALAQNYDANPTATFTYGTGNSYNPANAVVLGSIGDGSELAVRAHVNGQPAQSTGGTGIYTFNLGSVVNFDFSFFGSALSGANITVTNLLTGDDASFAAALLGTVQANTALQGSQQLGFGFLNGNPLAAEDINFNANQDNTYQITLNGGGQTLSAFAQFGTGAATAAVPEPATWAMMLMGFGAMGFALRRRKRMASLTQMA